MILENVITLGLMTSKLFYNTDLFFLKIESKKTKSNNKQGSVGYFIIF